MRPGQKNNRSRGRGNGGGRKNVNPLSRSYESNGPDVKVRGNPATIAEKYVQLARDAQASGDSVMAENYFQHAEHYFRIISAAQAQAQARQEERQKERSEQPKADDEALAKDRSEDTQTSVETNEDVAPEMAKTDEQQVADGEEKPARTRRAPRARRPRRKPAENAELSDAPQPSINLGDAEPPNTAPSNDDQPAKTGGDDTPATQAAE